MTSSHGNSNSHSNTVGHTNTEGGMGHANYGDHSVTFLGENYDGDSFPIDTCASTLTILYDKAEALRNQFGISHSMLPSTKPTTIQLGNKTNSNSLLYKLLRNGLGERILPAEYRIQRVYDARINYITESNHTNSGHSSATFAYYKGDDSSYYDEDIIPVGGGAYWLTKTPCFSAFDSYGITSETISGTTTLGSVASKSTLTSLIKIFNKYLVKTSKVNVKNYTADEAVYNTITGHSNYSSHNSDDSKREYKKNIEDYNESALDKINDVKIVKFNYLPKIGDSTIDRVGFIADDTDEIFSTHYHDRMDFMNCIGMLMKGVQELTEQVKTLEQKVKEKETEVKELKEIILKNEN